MLTLQELVHQVLPRLSGPAVCSIFEAVREVHAVICARMLSRRADLLKSPDPAVLLLPANLGWADLPEDCLALDGRPYFAGKALEPIIQKRAIQASGAPRFYSARGKRLFVEPVPSEDVEVVAPYFSRPMVPEQMSDELPFFGDFDEVYVNGCIGILSRGLSAVADRDFVAMIHAQVDVVLDAQDSLAEQAWADSINGL